MRQTRAHAKDEVTQLELEGRRIARQAAAEAIVLLENDGALPLRPGRIALYGAGAAMTIAGGTGSGEVNARSTCSVRLGLEEAGFRICTAARLDAYERRWHEARESFIREQRAKMRRPTPAMLGELIGMEFQHPADDPILAEEALATGADACVYVVARQSGEGADRADEPGSFRLTEGEISDIRICANAFRRTVVVLNVGAPIDLSWRHDVQGVNAIVLMGQLGMEGGRALADVMSGAQAPSGHLAVSWPESASQVPFADSFGRAAADPDSADYREGIYVGYRYYATFGVKPAYPFGHGLSYAEFQTSLTSARYGKGTVEAVFNVCNTGDAHAGKHVVQLYASCPEGQLDKERVRLVAFGKTGELAPGCGESVVLRFGLSDLASYDESEAQTVLEAGDYRLFAGESSEDLELVAVVRVAERAVMAQHRNVCRPREKVAQLAPPAPASAQPCETVPIVEVDNVGPAVRHAYGKRADILPEVAAIVDALGDSQLVELCTGTGLSDDGVGPCVPGAVGHTTASLRHLGIPNVELCDGPAGVRIQRRSAITSKGDIKPIDPPMSLYEVLPAAITRFMFGDADRDQVVYQFVTGFPAASAIAQTWNTRLAGQMGAQVGKEMEEYGVTYWLAPALNIVRNPLCGRNFEYYSEDPLVSGKMAAAVTCGVQEVPGRFACVKHFAANNQETNRNTSSSNVDERVLRELYLRGFQIAVSEGRPASVMASYNKVNGTYATESAELLGNVLRDEWGFDGVVMTDWFATGFGHADDCAALAAGVDLIMPGGLIPRLAIRAGLQSGKLQRQAVRTAAARVLANTLSASLG